MRPFFRLPAKNAGARASATAISPIASRRLAAGTHNGRAGRICAVAHQEPPPVACAQSRVGRVDMPDLPVVGARRIIANKAIHRGAKRTKKRDFIGRHALRYEEHLRLSMPARRCDV